MKRVIGTDAIDVVESTHGASSGSGVEAAIAQLGRDIETSIMQSPTTQLRRELTQYHTRVGTAQGTGHLLGALSHFDLLAGTQLRSCGYVLSEGKGYNVRPSLTTARPSSVAYERGVPLAAKCPTSPMA